MTAELIAGTILPALGGSQRADRLTDAATLEVGAEKLAFTTDSYVVQPLEFPGGDIGKLAVCGTLNDLAVVGSEPLAMSLSLVLEEGLEIELLRRVLASAGAAASEAGVAIVTGDTKAVERGGVVGMIVNTAGVGRMLPAADLGFDRISPGDEIVLSGPLGEHALAVMSCRKGLSFSAELESDCASVCGMARSLIERLGPKVHFLRDPTRGGLAATLAEVAAACGRQIEIDERAIPVNRTARAAAEMLGLDLLSAANEGKLLAFVAAGAGAAAAEILAADPLGRRAATIGRVGGTGDPPMVEMVTAIGGRRVVQMPYGEDLPRIC